MNIGKMIRELRESKGLSQTQLAKELNVRQTAISRWELSENEPDIKTIISLAKFFDVTTDYLLGLED